MDANRSSFNTLILSIFRVSISRDLRENIIFGGRSVFNGLLALYFGSVNPGLNLEQLRPPHCPHIKSATVLLYRNNFTGPLNDNFIRTLQSLTDFVFVSVHHDNNNISNAECKNINTLVASRTGNAITDGINPESFGYPGKAKLQTTTVFSGDWVCPFNTEDTRIKLFQTAGGMRGIETMMYAMPVVVGRYSYGGGTFYRLPYKNGVSMIVYMRSTPAVYGQIYDDIAWLSVQNRFEKMLPKIEEHQYGGVEMPKFSYMTSMDISAGVQKTHYLKDFNMFKMFANASLAPTQFSHEIHSKIENNEKGTSTESVFETFAYDGKTGEILKLNKPFCYFLIQASGHIINLGIFAGV